MLSRVIHDLLTQFVILLMQLFNALTAGSISYVTGIVNVIVLPFTYVIVANLAANVP